MIITIEIQCLRPFEADPWYLLLNIIYDNINKGIYSKRLFYTSYEEKLYLTLQELTCSIKDNKIMIRDNSIMKYCPKIIVI